MACGIWLRGAVKANHTAHYDMAHWCVYTIEGEGFETGVAPTLRLAKIDADAAISRYFREYRASQKEKNRCPDGKKLRDSPLS